MDFGWANKHISTQTGLTHAPAQPWAAGPAGSLGAARGLAGGFFDQLRQSFKQEVEKNKEFKESLNKLKVRTFCGPVWGGDICLPYLRCCPDFLEWG